jgi:hypothetical protein
MCSNYQLYYQESEKTCCLVLLSYDVLFFLFMICFYDSLSSLDCIESMPNWWPTAHNWPI